MKVANMSNKTSKLRHMADGGYVGDEYDLNVYQQNRMRDGGKVRGPGGDTDDKVGPVMLSNREYVLPGDTADAIGRDVLDEIRLATHDFVDKKKSSKLRGLANGGSPWIVDPEGVVRTGGPGSSLAVRPNYFGDAAAGPEYAQPKALAAPPKAWAPTNPNVGASGSAEAQAFRASTAPSTVAQTTPVAGAAPTASAASRAGNMARAVGGALAKGAGALGGVLAVGDMAANGVNAANTGDLAATGAALWGGPVGMAAAGGWGVGRLAQSALPESVSDAVGGVINSGLRSAGKRLGQDWGVDDTAYLNQKAEAQLADRLGRNPLPGFGSSAAPVQERAITAGTPSDQPSPYTPTPGSYQSRRLSEMGVPLGVQTSAPSGASVRTGGTSEFQNLGTYGGNGNIYGKATDPSNPGRMNSFAGVGAGANPSNEIGNTVQSMIHSALRSRGAEPTQPQNVGGGLVVGAEDRYDQLKRELRGSYSAKGKGNLARRLIEVEDMRSRDLNNERSSETARRNGELQAKAARYNTDAHSTSSLLNTLAGMENNRVDFASRTAAAQQKIMQDAMKYLDDREEKGYERFSKASEDMFASSGDDGKRVVDYDRLNRFMQFVDQTNPQARQNLMSMSPQEQSKYRADMMKSFEMNETRNKAASSGFFPKGATTNKLDNPTAVREAEFADVANKGLSMWDYLRSNAPFTNPNVVEFETGQVAPFEDVVNTRGKRDLDKMKLIQDSIRNRSKLRGD